MSTAVTPDRDALYTKMRAFLQYIVPSATEVVQGLGNRVPTPKDAHVVMTLLFQVRLATDEVAYTDPFPAPDPGSASYKQSTRVDMQIDFYGPAAANWAAMFSTLFRSQVGCDELAPDCQPLHADEARQIPNVTGEDQYLERWNVTGALQWNPVTSIPQEFADTLTVDLINVDEAYPP